jgi:hypothetical protein
MLLLLLGCCIVVSRLLLSLHAIMQPLMLTLLANFTAIPCPLPPPPLLPLPLGGHRCHRHHRDQTHCPPLQKKETTAAAPPAYQWQHHHENIYKSRRLGLI